MKYLTKLALPEKGDRVAPIHPVLGVYQLYRHLYRVVSTKPPDISVDKKHFGRQVNFP